MPNYAIAPSPIPALPIAGSDALFPVHRIYCVGRNYADHAREMGGDPNKEPPFFFQKNPDNLVIDGKLPYPPQTNELHHELELVVALAGPTAIFGCAVGLDMTRRDLQNQAKKLGRSWEVAKAFEHSAPISAIVPMSTAPSKGAIWLDVNGARKQSGDLDQLIWPVPQVIEFLGQLFELRAGDLIFTGTPAGVGPVVRGDQLHGHVDGAGDLQVTVV